jgi:hypothetical protein
MKGTVYALGFAVTISMAAGLAVAQPIANADSVSEFSCSQGEYNWSYGYYVAPFTSSTFQEMTQCLPNDPWYGGDAWWVDPQSYWTSLRSEIAFPNGPVSCGRLQVEHWAVRRWVSEVAGRITIAGTLANAISGFDGFTGHILVDGVPVYSQLIEGTDTVGVQYTVNTTVSVGSVVDFAIQPGASDCNDHARFTAMITRFVCPILGTLEDVPERAAILRTLYRFRDEVMTQSPEGRRHIRLFYRHAPEVSRLLLRHPSLHDRVRNMLVEMLPALRATLAGRPSTITRARLSDITTLLEPLAANAGPALRADLRSLQEDLRQGRLLEQYRITRSGTGSSAHLPKP